MVLEKYELLEFVEYFIDQAYDKDDTKFRIHAAELATLWYESFLDGRDGKNLDVDLKEKISSYTMDLGLDSRSAFEQLMTFAAHCNYSKVMEHKFMVTLYSTYKLYLPEDRNLDPFDAQIDEYITSHIQPNSEGRIQFCIKYDGLNSKVVTLPQNFSSWTDFGERFIFSY